MIFQFIYHGTPRGQERPRFGGYRAHKSDEARAYENAIAVAYKIAAGGRKPLEEPVGVRIAAGYPIPESDSRKRQGEKSAGRIWPTKKPDIDNVVKAVLDALNGLAWGDDKQVCFISAYKQYAQHPGLIVTISTGADLQRMKEG